MTIDDFEVRMKETVERYEELRKNFTALYREVSEEEIKQRFSLWEEDEPPVP
jgi:hypothetical protein